MKYTVDKGTHHYIKRKKKQMGLITALSFALVGILFAAGILTTHTRANMMTVVAILSVLPSAKFAVAFLMLLPHTSREEEEYQEVLQHAKEAGVLTELVITTGEKILPTAYLVIADGNACGYTDAEKYDTSYAEKFLTENLKKNGVKANIKIFRDKNQFLSRVDALAKMSPDEEQKKKDKRIGELFLTLTL